MGITKDLLYSRLHALADAEFISYQKGDFTGYKKHAFAFFNQDKIMQIRTQVLEESAQNPDLLDIGSIFEQEGEYFLGVVAYRNKDDIIIPVFQAIATSNMLHGHPSTLILNDLTDRSNDLSDSMPIGYILEPQRHYHEPIPEWPITFTAELYGNPFIVTLPKKFYTVFS